MSDGFDYDLLATLCEAPGIPGREARVRDRIREALNGLDLDLRVDAMGNLIAEAPGPSGAPRVMVSAHMDEIGFVVRHVDEKGFLRIHNLGGFDVRNLFARHVTVHVRDGAPRIGVLNPAVKPVHVASQEERTKIPEMDDFAVDLGLPAETVRAEVRVGDMVTLLPSFHDLGDVVTGKALDDRSGCWILIETLRRLAAPQVRVAAVFSVQEEVGVRGATTSAFGVAPDVGVALDTTLAIDTPGTPEHQAVTRMGDGVAIKISDGRSISQDWLVDRLGAMAEANDLPHQYEVLPRGGTDAAAIQQSRAGVASVTLSTPSRYVHTVTEMVAKRDLEAAVTLLGAFLSDADAVRAPDA
ncbi:MAG: M20/M25/M40 family metallo-hydrolase [Trueperaceae bacterium]|nr:M20/M25/M40 family metallo-hydrolase [Trueperaceae bacterium]